MTEKVVIMRNIKKALSCVIIIALSAIASLIFPYNALTDEKQDQSGKKGRAYIVKKVTDQVLIKSDSCGALRELIGIGDKVGLTLVIAENIKPTKGHYHRDFTEIYQVLDGSIDLKLYDPAAGVYWKESLKPNELCIIKPLVHHAITSSSPANRISVIAVPGFTGEILSDKL